MPEVKRVLETTPWYYTIGSVVKVEGQYGIVRGHERQWALIEMLYLATDEQKAEGDRWFRTCLGITDG